MENVTKEKVDDVLHAKWIIPVVPDNTVLENHSLIIKNGKIHDILPTEEARHRYEGERHHAIENHHVLIPGLVNMHCHAAMTLLRGFADDVSLEDWLSQYIWPAEGRWIGEEYIEDGTKLAVAEMLRCGVTCYNDMYFFPHVSARVTSDYGMRSAIGIPVIAFPSNWANDADDYIEKGLRELHDKYKDHPLVTVVMAPHSTYTMHDAGLLKAKKIADELGMRIHIHLHETAREVSDHQQNNEGMRPIERLQKLGLIDDKLIAAHMCHVTDDEIKLWAEKGAHVVHCPESNLKLASGICPVQKFSKAGVNVSLGTDGAASNDDLDLLGEMRTAALVDKLQAKDATAMPGWQMLKLATINGAKALGLEHKIGSLEKGKEADVVAIKLRTEPVYNPITNLVYVGTNSVTDVWVAGKQLVKDEKMIGMNEDVLLRKAQQWGEKIKTSRPPANPAHEVSA
ncbi:Nethylammeline chlorohydrolase [Acanthamoeba castellanii str. Neff]|jgi:5-methylthioadenosine/S-adenosylhomocysteine deaminase|uniref:Nethylammeline chlorohydrolase n=1 Tax=Acanthamoeba castellanii (strain ATCC 30010 / Neff) TaxID=1257118 RepID=L8GT16_ACACF|nr:Nethylammeline chlorohydrolase [Acanthamoeba castellanii str. Neff]ELR15271.1 Nethylammeline chlorohydrolase [Acanthamoeba castellanii str. Neff]